MWWWWWLPVPRGATEMDRLGEVGRSKEKRTDWAEGEAVATLRRGGETARLKKLEEREEKPDVEEAKAEEEEY